MGVCSMHSGALVCFPWSNAIALSLLAGLRLQTQQPSITINVNLKFIKDPVYCGDNYLDVRVVNG